MQRMFSAIWILGWTVNVSFGMPDRTSTIPPGLAIPNTSGFSHPITHMSKGGSAVCVSGVVSVNASTEHNLSFKYQTPENQTEVTQTIVSMWSAGVNFKDKISHGTQAVGGTYKIGATFCQPRSNASSSVQILTHGIGFDRRYWDFAPGYSYVDVATNAGYATFFYDRLGTGVSSKGDPLNLVQAPIQLEILNTLVTKLREGVFAGQSFEHVAGVGHSFGSALTQGITAKYPHALNAAVLTGWSVNITGMPAFSLGQNVAIASINQPRRFKGLSPGYLVLDTIISTQSTFFHFPGFDPEILALAEATKATVTIGEFFTTGATVRRANLFSGPIAAVAGEEDFGFCAGNCGNPKDLLDEEFIKLYPKVSAKNTTTYMAPMAGHGVNLHYSALEAFSYIQNFLQTRGIV